MDLLEQLPSELISILVFYLEYPDLIEFEEVLGKIDYESLFCSYYPVSSKVIRKLMTIDKSLRKYTGCWKVLFYDYNYVMKKGYPTTISLQELDEYGDKISNITLDLYSSYILYTKNNEYYCYKDCANEMGICSYMLAYHIQNIIVSLTTNNIVPAKKGDLLIKDSEIYTNCDSIIYRGTYYGHLYPLILVYLKLLSIEDSKKVLEIIDMQVGDYDNFYQKDKAKYHIIHKYAEILKQGHKYLSKLEIYR
jgi:hypothetical protein